MWMISLLFSPASGFIHLKSFFPVALLPTSKGSCLYSMKVWDAIECFLLVLLPHPNTVLEIPECLEWFSSMLLPYPLLSGGCLPSAVSARPLFPQALAYYPQTPREDLRKELVSGCRSLCG